MKIWFERALAGLRWVWEKLVTFAKWTLAKLKVIFDTVYDPPPRTIRFWFWSLAAIIACCWITFAFVNSWYYKPVAAYFASLGDDGDVELPNLEPLPSVPTPAMSLPPVELVCFDASDTPHCEPVVKATPVVETVEVLPPVAAQALPTRNKIRGQRKAKRKPVETYWGF